MAHYIIQTVAFQLFFLIIYDLFLKKETFFNWNRAYLLITAALSLTIPFVKIDRFKNVMSPEFIINLPEVIIGNIKQPKVNSGALEPSVITETSLWSWEFVFYIGMGVATLLFLFKIVKLFLMLYKNPKTKIGHVFVVHLLNSSAAFSFFNYIFLGERIHEAEKAAILKHEMAHVKQRHTLDLLLFEMLRILFWFNPLVYMYQNRMMTLHEFIADAQAVKHQDKSGYYQNLLSQVFQTKNISFINPFYKQSLIKKRIVMLQRLKSKQVKLFKYALLLPLVFGMLMYSSCEKGNETNQTDTLDLSQYNYTRKKGESQMSKENEAIHDKHIVFLKANPEYTSWAIFDEESETISYSVHSADEKLPKEFEPQSREVNFSEGEGSYKMFFLFKRLPETEESKKQKAEKLLKQKEEYNDAVEVPFAFIEHVPVFPGCENMTNEEQKDCMSNKITMHVSKNFNTNIAKENGLTARQRINVIFKIDTRGNIVGVHARAPHPALEAEAIRVIKTLPKMIPGKQKGHVVTVPYSLPIVFQVSE